MTQDEFWQSKWQEMMTFIKTNKRNPSKHSDEERGKYLNWLRHNRQLLNSGELKMERVGMFKELLAMMEEYKRVNQWG